MTQGFPTPNEVQAVYHHQRTSSDSFLLEEQPSWFEELLNDESVEAPVTGNHRRSLSDSFTYLDATPNIASKEEVFMFKDTISTTTGPPPKVSNHNHELNYQEIMSYALFHTNPKSSNENEFRESSSTSSTFSIGLPISTKNAMTGLHTSEASCIPNKSNSMTTDQEEPNFMPNGSDCSHANPPAQNKDSRRSKQQATHGSRVRKLRYIVQLERHLRALQAKGSQVSAELEFLDRHYLILGMENRALKHQLDCLMQEQFIKCLEQDMLEREVARLRNLYQQQQQRQQSAHHGSKISDPEYQHENLFVRH